MWAALPSTEHTLTDIIIHCQWEALANTLIRPAEHSTGYIDKVEVRYFFFIAIAILFSLRLSVSCMSTLSFL